MEQNIYKLTSGKAKGAWQLPLTEVLISKIIDKKDKGLKKIKFVPGSDSFFAEDVSGDLKSETIWFDNGVLYVPKNDTLKNSLLQAHPWFNVYYELFDKTAEDRLKLNDLRLKNSARKLIEDSDIAKIKAIALAIFGQVALDWNEDTSELQLLNYADTNPVQLQGEFVDINYESKYLAALAITNGVVRSNIGKTAVVWNDSTEGVILPLAKGENAIQKLGELLSVRSDESELILQEIGARLQEKEINLPKNSEQPAEDDKDLELKASKQEVKELKDQLGDTSVLDAKDQEIEDLKRQLAENNKSSETVKTQPMTLEEARAKYAEQEGNKVPNNKNNNLEWILGKLIKE